MKNGKAFLTGSGKLYKITSKDDSIVMHIVAKNQDQIKEWLWHRNEYAVFCFDLIDTYAEFCFGEIDSNDRDDAFMKMLEVHSYIEEATIINEKQP